jgi:hypothetical protein
MLLLPHMDLRGLRGEAMSAIEMLMRAHYHLMDNPRFWYDRGLLEASKVICVTASNMRKEARKNG